MAFLTETFDVNELPQGKAGKKWQYGDPAPKDWQETADILKQHPFRPKIKRSASEGHLVAIEKLLKDRK